MTITTTSLSAAAACLSIAILATGPAQAIEARFRCSGGVSLTADFSPPSTSYGSVTLTFGNGNRLVLPQVLSADGGRYANDTVEFWVKGRGATLTRNGRQQNCRTRS